MSKICCTFAHFLQAKAQNNKKYGDMRKIYFFIAALFSCIMNVQLNAQQTILYESDGIHYVLVELSFGDVTTRTAYVVHPLTTIEDEDAPSTPSSYTGVIVIQDTISYEGKDFPVKFIDENAFFQSTVTSIDLPEAVSVFNSGAFKDCQTLQTIICRAQTPPSTRIHSIPWNYNDVFGSLAPEQVSVYVPSGAVRIYQETSGWDEFTHYSAIESMQGLESVTGDLSPKTKKVIIDGQLIIIRDGKTFNALGTKLH